MNYASFSPDGRRLVTAGNDNTAQIWDLTTGQACLPPLQHANAVQQARFNFDGSRVVTMSWDNTVRIWDATTGQPTTPPMLHQVIIFTAAFSPDGRWVVTASNDGYARVWNAATGKLVTPPLRHPKSVLAANFNPAGDRVVTCGFDGAARVWDVATGELVLPLLRHGGMVNSAVFSSDGHRVLTTSSDGVARLWDIEPRKLTFAPWAEEDPQIVGASEDGTRLITRDAAEQVRIWDTDTWQAVAPPIRIENPDLLTLSRDLTRLVAASHDAAQTGTQLQFKVWEVATARLMSQIDGPAGPAGNVHFSADGRLALIVRDNEVERWDVTQGKLPGPPLKHPSPVSCVVFSADACRCATSNSNHVHIWETATGKEILPTLECPNEVNVLSFSPDGGLFATACSDAILEGREARVWDAVTGKPVSPPLKHGDGVTFVVFSPDGRRVVTCGEDRAVRIWDARTGKPLTSPLLHAAMPSFAAFSTDGRRLVTSGRYPMVRVWDAMTGEPLTLPMICDGVADRADFLAHGRYVLGGGAGHLQILDLPVESRPTADLRSLACLLTSSKIDHTGVFEPLSAEALKEAWTSLKANYPDDISPLKRHASNIPPGATDADSLTPAAAERLVLAARLRARGAHYAQFTQWPLALADLTKSIEGNPDEHETWYQLAPLLLETGDAAAYRKHCQAMLARFGRTRDPAIAGRTARVCLLLPLDGADLETACHLAEIAVTLGKEHPWRVNFQATKGLAEYRQAHFAQAVEWTRQALSQPDDNCAWDVQAKAVLAMALHRLNQGGPAREALRKATQLDDMMLPKLDSGDLGPSWHAWIFARTLLREAKALIEGGTKTGDSSQ